MKFFHPAVLATVVLFAAARLASADLIVNGGFETGDFTGWSQVNGAVVTTDLGVPPHSGNYQAEFGNGSLTQSVATTPGRSYTIDFWLLNFNNSLNALSVSWGGSPILSLLRSPAFPYTEYTFTETASTASTALLFQFNQEDGAWFLDDVSVNPVAAGVPDSGSTLGLLLLSLAGLFCARRFRSLRLA